MDSYISQKASLSNKLKNEKQEEERMNITLRLPNWRTTDLGRWDTLEDYLHFIVRSVQYTQGDDKELLLQKIDELHHYLERTLGRSDHTLVMLQLNYPDVYHQLVQNDGECLT